MALICPLTELPPSHGPVVSFPLWLPGPSPPCTRLNQSPCRIPLCDCLYPRPGAGLGTRTCYLRFPRAASLLSLLLQDLYKVSEWLGLLLH